MIKLKKMQQTLKSISNIAKILSERGWAEANAGNISVNVSDAIGEEFDSSNFQKNSEDFGFLNNTSIIITSAGSRMRDIAISAEKYCGILTFITGEKGYYISKFGENEFVPTSEYLSHINIHKYLANSGRSEKAVVHSHPEELIAAMHREDLNSEIKINSVFNSMHSEFSMLIPNKIGYIPFTEPGSKDLADKTLKKLEDHNVVFWKNHGCISIGDTLDLALDNIEIVNKIAKIFFLQK
ncbi:MAG: class II aldolase/adducin family protein [Candidatus Delongbacteria bacterium]|jgi:rhamnulose-1-phosphate aldolase|nr:class II aldolase/adducin family protein [Candidatus Delongbacteria bacterium]